ncbi:MAG: hypothetical protein ACI845_001637 [Gammaproteobacteria bacterium]|jgi:hypothetical protein
MTNQDFGIYHSLLSSSAVRERCHRIGQLAMAGQTNWFSIDQSKFDQCVEFVADTCRQNYPDLKIPLHSRWRHFEVGGIDLWHHYTGEFSGDKLALARSAIDLTFVSVLVDAGSGSSWCFRDDITGVELTRSEGLAAASISLFFNKLAQFSSDQGWRIGAEDLLQLDQTELAEVFQHSKGNPLLGLEGRLQLLHGLARVLQTSKDNQFVYTRPGCLIDECLSLAQEGPGEKTIDITQVLAIVLERFGDMWPSGFRQQNLNLGDCGYHSLLTTDDPTTGIIPFHKLSQWLTYSLIEPLQWAGFEVTNLDGLTGLPEYRNGGLFIDTGTLQILDNKLLDESLSIDSEAVVEWRALTVFLLDQLADAVREKLGLDEDQLPLGSVLQGGSWAAGRRIASQLRSDARPPLKLAIDGTIF